MGSKNQSTNAQHMGTSWNIQVLQTSRLCKALIVIKDTLIKYTSWFFSALFSQWTIPYTSFHSLTSSWLKYVEKLKLCRCVFTRSASGDRYMVMVKTLQARPSCESWVLPGGTIMLKYTHDTHNIHTMPNVCRNTFIWKRHPHTKKQSKINSNCSKTLYDWVTI